MARKHKTLADYDGIEYTNNHGDKYIVVQYIDARNVKVRFVESGYEMWTESYKFKKGTIKDITMTERKMLGKTFKNLANREFKVIEYIDRQNIIIEFVKSPRKMKTTIDKILTRDIKHPMEISLYGVACLGQPNKDIKQYTRKYDTWRNMLNRVYGEQTYTGVEVCTRWKCFEYFLEDIIKLDGYNEWLEKPSWQLDKDIKLGYMKIYSSEHCMFVSREDNIREMVGRRNA